MVNVKSGYSMTLHQIEEQDIHSTALVLKMLHILGLKSPADDDEADDNTADDNEGDVQKKIMPWRQMMLDEEAMSEVEHGVKQHIEDRLVVVTSLINKVPNLGGNLIV